MTHHPPPLHTRLFALYAMWLVVTLCTSTASAQTSPPPDDTADPHATPLPSPVETAQTPRAEAEEDTDWFVLPAFYYNPDEGFGYGLRADFVHLNGVSTPFDWRLYLRVNHSTRNRHDHAFLFDNVGMSGSSLRVIAFTVYQTIDDAVFAGVGNDTPTPDPKRDIFASKAWRSRVLVQSFLGESLWLLGGGLTAALTDISGIPQGSVLAREQRPGLQGGFDLAPIVYMGYDSRDKEIAPTRGIFWEVYLFGSSEAALSSFSTVTFGSQVSHFLSLAPKLVLGQRVMAEDISGDVPFYEMARLGGRFRPRGVGGVFSQRGFLEGRFAGRTKSVYNVELRYSFPEFWDGAILGVAPFADVSHVWDETDRFSEFFGNLNSSGGLEISTRWRDSFLVRFDYAISREDGLFYIQAQHMF